MGLGEVSASAPTNGTYFIGSTSTPNSAANYVSFSTSGTFLKAAPGSYTFYLTATRESVGNIATFYRSHLKAFYFPTSYGPVSMPVPPSEAAAFEESTIITDERTGTPMHMVDLRELELKAAKLKAEATAAELALVKARNTQHLNPTRDGSSADDKR
jgi:hypothetical protein